LRDERRAIHIHRSAARVTASSVAHRSIVNSIIPSYPQLPARRVGGWVVAVAIALILGSTAFALWAILALR
jgi:hypothetical protein